jgi:hypothetical protein
VIVKMARSAVLIAALAGAPMAQAESAPAPLSLTVHADQPGPVINRDIFGQFAEHLGGFATAGRCARRAAAWRPDQPRRQQRSFRLSN